MLVRMSIHLDEELADQVRLYVYSRKMLDKDISISKVVAQALREHFAKAK